MKRNAFKVGFVVALIVFAYLGVALGPSFASWNALSLILNKLLQPLGVAPLEGTESFKGMVVWNLRLPRVLLGVFVGAGLGLSGAALQALFRNPLADPGVVGISSGCALGAVGAIVLGEPIHLALAQSHPLLASFWVVACAFAVGLLTVLSILIVSRSLSTLNTTTFLLAGIALGSLAMAGIGLLIHLADDLQIRELTFWQMGSLGRTTWLQAQVAAVLIVVPSCCLLGYGRAFNLFLLGDGDARSLGLRTERMKVLSILAVALIVAASVSFSGIIVFVGLVVPHVLRLSIGSDHGGLLPYSCVVGALFLVAADLGARVLLPPTEVALGVLTALVGAPFFLVLILKNRATHGLSV